jgi:hypothetical protein
MELPRVAFLTLKHCVRIDIISEVGDRMGNRGWIAGHRGTLLQVRHLTEILTEAPWAPRKENNELLLERCSSSWSLVL